MKATKNSVNDTIFLLRLLQQQLFRSIHSLVPQKKTGLKSFVACKDDENYFNLFLFSMLMVGKLKLVAGHTEPMAHHQRASGG